ncbi:MAG: virulence RhuM family protein [Bacteroidaceae bacterium]|nr:virulence RhuM family protein [Bacteroidaceae bacterium]
MRARDSELNVRWGIICTPTRMMASDGKHINNALQEELNPELLRSKNGLTQVVAKFATTASDGKVYQVEHYSLDMILSVGYRVKST